MDNQLAKTVKSIIRQRKKLIQIGKSFRNDMRCLKIIKQLSLYIDAYESKWNTDGWKTFVRNNYNEIMYLIPNNKSGETIKQKINASL